MNISTLGTTELLLVIGLIIGLIVILVAASLRGFLFESVDLKGCALSLVALNTTAL